MDFSYETILTLLSYSKGLLVLSNVFIFIFVIYFKKIQNQPEQIEKTFLKKKFGLIIAHPDDESMFFVPSIVGLRENGNEVHLLSLSNGNFDGLGKIRETELEKAGKFLNLNSIEVIDDKYLQDGFNNKWDSNLIGKYVKSFVEKNQIDCLITFDDYGISGHPNHINTSKGVQNYEIYHLNSCSIFRKYIGILDWFLWLVYDPVDDNSFTFFTPNLWDCYEAMKLHYSQWVWFRKLSVLFSRYSYVNTLKKK